MQRVSVFDFINGYKKSANKEEGKKFISATVTGSFAGRYNSKPIKMFMGFTAKLKSLLAYTSIRCYGLFLLSFGLTMLSVHFVKDYLGGGYSAPLGVLIVGVLSAMLGVFAVVSDKPMAIALQDFALTDFIFFEFFCIKRVHRRIDSAGLPTGIGLVAGAFSAALTWFFSPELVILSVVGICYAYVVMLSPEFSLFSTFLILPYLSLLAHHEVILSVFVIMNLISFARKVVLGRRVMYMEQYDVCLVVFILFVLISGIFVKGIESFTNSLVMIVLASGYLLSGCIIANRRLADCLINALIFSSFPVSLLACVQFVLFVWERPIGEFTGVSATFSSTEVLAVFLLTSLVFGVYFIRARRSRIAKALYGGISLITFAALVFTYNVFAIVVAVSSFLIYAVFSRTRILAVVVTVLAIVISLPAFLPSGFTERFVSYEIFAPLQLSQYVERWQTARQMLASNLLAGIGIGGDCFVEELIDGGYTLTGCTDGGSFFLEIAVEAGIFALAALLLILLIRIRHRIVYVTYVKNSQLSILSKFTVIATFSLLAFGGMNYLWSDMSMYFLFWCVFGVGSATLRISKQEHDDRIGYYSDGRSTESSSIDVDI